MTSKKEFLNFPIDNYTTAIFSIGQPGTGKTFTMMNSIEFYLTHPKKPFSEFHLVLPSVKNEMSGSYDWLLKEKNVFVYEAYHPMISEKIIKECAKNNDLFKAGKIKEKPKIFFAVDDATSQGKKLMTCPNIIRLSTENRHLNVQSWFALHYTANIIPPKVRQNMKFVFIHDIHIKTLKKCWEDFVNFKEFRKFDDFLAFWDEYVAKNKYGCLLIKGNEEYNPIVSTWFKDKKK
jgi:hypothetical protein